MLRIIVDTNVLVSSLLASGPSSAILDLWRNKRFTLISSIDLLNELITTLNRPRISKRISETDAKDLVKLLEERALFVAPEVKIEVCRDPHDDKLLKCAIESKANIIATGDKDLLTLHPFRGIDIIPPADVIKRIL